MNPIIPIALSSIVAGLMQTGIFYTYGRAVNKHKGKAFRPALTVGIVTAVATALATTATYYFAGSAVAAPSVSGMGLLNVQRGQSRLGLYIPAPTVKKYPAFTGTQYYR